MKLRTSYIIYVLLLHLVFALLATQILAVSKTYFVVSELLILGSLVLSFYFLKAFTSPINLIDAGIQSLKDREFNTKFLKVGQYEMDTLIDVYNQMIDVLRSERLNKVEQNYFLEKLVQASPSGIVILDLNDKIKSLNPSALRILGQQRTELIGKSLDQVDSKIASNLISLNVGKSSVITVEGSKKYKCQKDQFLYNGFQQTFMVIEDLTYELLHTEKNAYEKVIRMMSHEVNNSVGAINSILNSILAYSDQLNEDTRLDYENVIKVATDRNTGFINLMRNFSDVVKIPAPNKQNHDINELVVAVAVFTEPLCRKRTVKLEVNTHSSPLMAAFDVNQMQQVLVNIVKNALESIQSSGHIKISVLPQAEVIVEDNGRGIAEDIKNQLFTPFFSTKQDGQGIGLTMTKEVLMNHGFDFNLETIAPGVTQFHIKMLASA